MWWCGALAAVAWLAIAGFGERWSEERNVGPTGLLARGMAAVAVF
jgi:hypothetical protein